MRETRIVMGMPATVEVADAAAARESLEEVFRYFAAVDERFSTYKQGSEIMRINRKEISAAQYSNDMKEILALAEKTKQQTAGYFDIRRPDGILDPSGVVKGWAIQHASELLLDRGFENHYVEISGDIQTSGKDGKGMEWSVGIRNPFKREEIVKVLYPRGKGVATSGTAARGQHIYNPHDPHRPLTDIVSLTVIGQGACEADRFATAAFAMGADGIVFIERLNGFGGYAIDQAGTATMTSDFEQYTTI